MTAALRALLIVGGAAILLLPPRVFGHSAEFILAKVLPQEGGVLVELTLDCSGHPAIENEAQARAILEKVLRVRAGRETHDLGALAPLHFERRTRIDPSAPIPRDPEDETAPHRLVCAVWSWSGAPEKIAFEVPADAGQSLLLWKPPAEPGKSPAWVILLGGDVSPEIAIPRRRVFATVATSLGTLLGISLLAMWLLRPKHQPSTPAIGSTRRSAPNQSGDKPTHSTTTPALPS